MRSIAVAASRSIGYARIGEALYLKGDSNTMMSAVTSVLKLAPAPAPFGYTHVSTFVRPLPLKLPLMVVSNRIRTPRRA